MRNETPLADCIGAPSPCAPSTSAKGFIAIGTSAMCDLPSEPLYTRQIFGMSARRGGFRQDAVALAEGMLAVVLGDELDPTVQHVEHLEVALVLVQAGGVQVVIAGRLLLDPDDVGAELPCVACSMPRSRYSMKLRKPVLYTAFVARFALNSCSCPLIVDPSCEVSVRP